MENEWEKEKEKILNSLLGAGQESLDFAAEAEVWISVDILVFSVFTDKLVVFFFLLFMNSDVN